MKLLFLNTLYAPYIGGGAEIILQEQAEGLMNLGHSVSVLCTGPESGLHETFVDGIKVYRGGLRNLYFPFGKSTSSTLRRAFWHFVDIYNPFMKDHIRRVITIEKPDVVSCHNLSGWSIAAWDAVSEFDIPVVQVLHDHYLLCPRSTMFDGKCACDGQCRACRCMRLPHATASNRVSAVVGVSQFMLDYLISFGYFRETRIRKVIHNVRDITLPEYVRGKAEKSRGPVFGYIGTLQPAKGIELLLKTFSDIALPEWRLNVAGTGKSDYEMFLKNRYHDPRITFLGYCRQQDFFKSIDICVVPSLWKEALGMVVAESLLFGIPVIASDRGGIPEMICEEKNGMLFRPDNPSGLEKAMNEMAANIDDWRVRFPEIIQSAASFTGKERWLRQYENLYQDSVSI